MAKKKAAKDKKPTKGTHVDHPRDDGSVTFTVNDGPLQGRTWRMYPDNARAARRDSHIPDWPVVTWEELGYPDRCGDYHPETWNPAKPMYVWKDRTE